MRVPCLLSVNLPEIQCRFRPASLHQPPEYQTAHEAGSDFIKIFPADSLGPNYIKALLAPLNHLRIIPTGGVNLDTMESFLAAGSAALGIGSSLLKNNIIKSKKWSDLELLSKQHVDKLSKIKTI